MKAVGSVRVSPRRHAGGGTNILIADIDRNAGVRAIAIQSNMGVSEDVSGGTG